MDNEERVERGKGEGEEEVEKPRHQLGHTHINFLEEVWISNGEACETISAELNGGYLADCPK